MMKPFLQEELAEAFLKIQISLTAAPRNGIHIKGDIPENIPVSSIVYDPNDLKTFYVGTGESYTLEQKPLGNGLWKSSDAGQTWTNVFGGKSENRNCL